MSPKWLSGFLLWIENVPTSQWNRHECSLFTVCGAAPVFAWHHHNNRLSLCHTSSEGKRTFQLACTILQKRHGGIILDAGSSLRTDTLQWPFVVATGLQTSQDARFYAVSSRFDDFNNQGKPLVIQFTVKHEQNIDCGGGYIKLFPSGLNQENMHGDSVYNIMFGEWG